MQNTGMQGSTPLDSTSYAGTVRDEANAGLHRLSESAQHSLERFGHAASEAAQRLSTQSQALMRGPAAESARIYMREHPLATIGIAVAIGVLLSRLLSRR